MREDLKKKLSIYGSTALVAILILYAIFQGRELLFGSPLTVITSDNGQNVLALSGNAGRAQKLLIDGRLMPLDAKGTFSESVALLPGENVITVSSIDQFGKSKSQTIYDYEPVTVETAANIPPAPGTPGPETDVN